MCSPTPPDPQTIINAQTDSNIDTAITQAGLNAVNQTDAMGNTLTWNQIGKWADGTPRYGVTQTLSDAGKTLLDTNQRTQQTLADLGSQQASRLGSLLNQPIDFSGAPAAGVAPTYQNFDGGPALDATYNDFSADRTRVEDALFSRLQPQMDRDAQAFEASLINRGIRPGSDAFRDEMSRFQQGVNDQRTSVLLQAGQEQSRLESDARARASFGNQSRQQEYANRFGATSANNALRDQTFANQNVARQNAIAEMLTKRNVPLNELLALAGQGQIASPSFTNTPQTGVAGTDVGGIFNSAFNNQNTQYNNQQSLLGGLFSAGASLLPLLSDRRAKRDIQRIGTTDAGTAVYSFRYLDSDDVHIGVMAQEVMASNPDAVWMAEDGLLRVNYAMVA